MEATQDDYIPMFDNVEQRVRKYMQQDPAHVSVNWGEEFGIVRYQVGRFAYCSQEPFPESRLSILYQSRA